MYVCLFVCLFLSQKVNSTWAFAWSYDLGFTTPNARSTSGEIVRLQRARQFPSPFHMPLLGMFTRKGSCKT